MPMLCALFVFVLQAIGITPAALWNHCRCTPYYKANCPSIIQWCHVLADLHEHDAATLLFDFKQKFLLAAVSQE